MQVAGHTGGWRGCDNNPGNNPEETCHRKDGGGSQYEILVLWVTWLEPETQMPLD